MAGLLKMTTAMLIVPMASGVVTHSPFATRALSIVAKHPIVTKNEYTEWFAKGEATIPQAQQMVKQFSVFSNLFLLAQRACFIITMQHAYPTCTGYHCATRIAPAALHAHTHIACTREGSTDPTLVHHQRAI